MTTKDKTAPQRVARYTQKRKEEGWVKLYLWAKNKQDAEAVRAFAKELREKGK